MLDTEFHYVLMRCFNKSNKLIVQRTAQLGLYPGQPKILECLLEEDGQTPKNIGRRCVLDKSTITSLLNKMEQQKLVFRQIQSADKRSVKIFLTDLGREKAAEVKKICQQVDDLALSRLSLTQQRKLTQFLHEVLFTFEEASLHE